MDGARWRDQLVYMYAAGVHVCPRARMSGVRGAVVRGVRSDANGTRWMERGGGISWSRLQPVQSITHTTLLSTSCRCRHLPHRGHIQQKSTQVHHHIHGPRRAFVCFLLCRDEWSPIPDRIEQLGDLIRRNPRHELDQAPVQLVVVEPVPIRCHVRILSEELLRIPLPVDI